MTKIDWKSKLTSRKFWAAICNFVGMLVLFFKGTQETATQVTALIMAGAGVIAYIIGEGLIDAASAGQDTYLFDSQNEAEVTHPPEEENA